MIFTRTKSSSSQKSSGSPSPAGEGAGGWGAPWRAILLLLALKSSAQTLTLPALIQQTLTTAAPSLQARAAREGGYWAYRAYQASYRPQLALAGTVPNFNRLITPVVQPDGTIAFQSVRNNNSLLGLAVTQNIGLTGGQVVVGSQVQRFDNFVGNTKQYNTQPFNLSLNQPLGYFNGLKWDRRIEPLLYQESQRQYLEDREAIAQRVTELYFDVLLQQVNATVAGQNAQATAELLRVGREKYKLGRLSQSDLLQLELNLLDAQQAQAQALLDADNAAVGLRTYCALPAAEADAATPPLAVPTPAPTPAVVPAEALAQARQHRVAVLAFQRRQLQAARTVALARGTTGLLATLTANLGYVNQAPYLADSYLSLQNQQQVALAFSLPLVDWGRRRATIRTAELARDQTQAAVSQDERSFAQNVLTQASQVPTLAGQTRRAARADTLAQRRYAITRATYEAGRLSLTDLTLASAAKDLARRGYILTLRAGWVGYYRLRGLTLFDFETQQPLAAE
ncbi:TolC family protein [Hymenobacter sp. H14-R3]|uniref:TolC family protein n=1 Tax=Hymenobacter sp. H14-R3 TaxID=3046308 RepID=UPI0024B93837|nr:TolC family protein [Hymenobacter sp. H14-R3]MDJ0364898.1 TolC family protein [Hymenobacter sp. H14-R3]